MRSASKPQIVQQRPDQPDNESQRRDAGNPLAPHFNPVVLVSVGRAKMITRPVGGVRKRTAKGRYAGARQFFQRVFRLCLLFIVEIFVPLAHAAN